MIKEMNAAVLHAPGDLRVERKQVPNDLRGNEVLVNVKFAGICGSDIVRVMESGTYSFPTVPGHEFCGEVCKTGNMVKNFKIGDRVVVAPMMPCYQCEMCSMGNYGQCKSYDFIGSRSDGAFAEFVKIPENNLILLPQKVSWQEGACIEPAAVTLHGMKKLKLDPGCSVAVMGCGPIGLFAIQFAKIMGAGQVLAVDIDDEKIKIAEKEADICINARRYDSVAQIIDLTRGQGVEIAIETAGVSVTQEQCLNITKEHGSVLYLGTAHEDVLIHSASFENILRKELKIFGGWNSYSAPFPGNEWHATLDYIRDGRLKAKPLISHVFPLERAPDVFKDLFNKNYFFNKVLFEI